MFEEPIPLHVRILHGNFTCAELARELGYTRIHLAQSLGNCRKMSAMMALVIATYSRGKLCPYALLRKYGDYDKGCETLTKLIRHYGDNPPSYRPDRRVHPKIVDFSDVQKPD
jgi:hypothetical protein